MNTVQACKIQVHGENLLRIFPNAAEQDPVKLCKKLRRIEKQAAKIGLSLCNDSTYTDEMACDDCEAVYLKLDALLHMYAEQVPVFVNRDPRGYALKIRSEWIHENNVLIERDWGGYGIIAPEIAK